jgi:hypothetical protein
VNKQPAAEVSSNFKLVFLCIFGLTLLCFVGMVVLAVCSSATMENSVPLAQRNLQVMCNFGWQAGLGAMLGLLGGKSTK